MPALVTLASIGQALTVLAEHDGLDGDAMEALARLAVEPQLLASPGLDHLDAMLPARVVAMPHQGGPTGAEGDGDEGKPPDLVCGRHGLTCSMARTTSAGRSARWIVTSAPRVLCTRPRSILAGPRVMTWSIPMSRSVATA